MHVYPSSWGVPNTDYTWVNDDWIGDRAALAAAAGKPLLFEVRAMTLSGDGANCVMQCYYLLLSVRLPIIDYFSVTRCTLLSRQYIMQSRPG